jgi:anti-anti-sigma factor
MPNLDIQLRRATHANTGAPIAWVILDGFLDASTVLEFENTLDFLSREEHTDVVVNFRKVLYANSTAIGTLLNYRNRLIEQGRELVLVRVSPEVRVTFDLLGLSTVVPCLRDEEAALAHLDSTLEPSEEAEAPAEAERAAAEAAAEEESPEPPEPTASRIMMVVPEENRFTDVTSMRLVKPDGQLRIVTDCTEALHTFGDLDPDLVILEDKLPGSEDFLWQVKTEQGRSIIPIIKLYWTGTDIGTRKEFKIWEDDFLIEPFELMELFALGESELRRIPDDRKRLLHATHFEFRTRDAHVARARELGATLIAKAGLNGDAATSVSAAFAEAIDNAARHGHHSVPEKCVDVVFLVDHEKLSITVTDEGEGFDFQPYLDRAVSADPLDAGRLRQSRGGLGGLGIALMFQSVDVLTYLGSGNAVRLVKRR